MIHLLTYIWPFVLWLPTMAHQPPPAHIAIDTITLAAHAPGGNGAPYTQIRVTVTNDAQDDYQSITIFLYSKLPNGILRYEYDASITVHRPTEPSAEPLQTYTATVPIFFHTYRINSYQPDWLASSIMILAPHPRRGASYIAPSLRLDCAWDCEPYHIRVPQLDQSLGFGPTTIKLPRIPEGYPR